MSPNPNDTASSCRLHRFERNRYFHGKLMTARDMEAEQQYHVGRQRTLTRNVTGEGLLCGLDVMIDENSSEDTFEIRVGRGLAVDCCGNPIVVKNAATTELSAPSGDEVYVHLTFDECSKETVPIPGSENACEPECAYNRVLEIFEIDYRESPPAYKTVPDTVEFPDSDDVDADEDDALSTMARSYYDGSLSECEDCDDPSVFLGAFERSGDDWVEAATDRRPIVYTNDMLYAALARHVADFGNPHEVTAAQAGALVSVADVANPGGNVDFTSGGGVLIDPDDDANEVAFDATAASVGALESVAGVANPGGNVDVVSDGTIEVASDDDGNEVDLRVAGEITDQLADLDDRLDDLGDELDANVDRLRKRIVPLERYVMDKTLKYKLRVFTLVANRFDTETAGQLTERARTEIDEELFRDSEAYFEFLEDAAEMEQVIGNELEGQVTERSLSRYRNAVDGLIERLEDVEAVVDAAVEQDFVCETAERLRPAKPEERDVEIDQPRIDVNHPWIDVDKPRIDETEPQLDSLDKLGPKRYELLRGGDVLDLRDLAESDAEVIAAIAEVDEELADQWISEARRILRR